MQTMSETASELGPETISRARKVGFSLVALLILVGLAEAAGQLLYARRKPADRYLVQDYYKNRDWSVDLLTTQESLSLRFEPYVGWRRTDCTSEFLNVNDGIRRTVHPSEPSPEAVVVWMFGGSTMWGEGVRDIATIPSHFARIAAEHGLNVRVVNLGESGWVSTQEALLLSLKLRAGEKPDIAVFYDGVNDTFATYQSGLTDGGPQNRDMFENYFRLGYDPRRRLRNSIALYRILRRVTLEFSDEWTAAVGTTVDADDTARKLMSMYLGNVDFVRRMAGAYDFDSVFFWQPTIVFQENFETTERDAYTRGASRNLHGMLDFYKRTTELLPDDGVIDVSRCLGPSPAEGWFIDHNHLNEAGNAVVARALFERLQPLIEKRRSEQPGGSDAS